MIFENAGSIPKYFVRMPVWAMAHRSIHPAMMMMMILPRLSFVPASNARSPTPTNSIAVVTTMSYPGCCFFAVAAIAYTNFGCAAFVLCVVEGFGVTWLTKGMLVPGHVGIHHGSFGMLNPPLPLLPLLPPAGVTVPAPVKMMALICDKLETRLSPIRMRPIQSTIRSLLFMLVVRHFLATD